MTNNKEHKICNIIHQNEFLDILFLSWDKLPTGNNYLLQHLQIHRDEWLKKTQSALKIHALTNITRTLNKTESYIIQTVCTSNTLK